MKAMQNMDIVRDPWNGGLYMISAVKKGLVTLIPMGGGKPLMVRQAILDFFYKRETANKGGS